MASPDLSARTAPGPHTRDRVVLHSSQGGTELLNMEEVVRAQLQDSETSFVQANSQVVVDSERSRCVQTDDLEEASDILQETGRVILCGFPGTGKTTVGHALLRRCREEGFKPYILSKLEDWHAHIGPGRRSFVLIDAILGEVRVNRQQHEEWTKILRNMLELIKAGDCRVVVTLYPHVLHELQQLEADSQSPLSDSSAVVRLMKEDLDTEVKRELLEFHLKQLPLQPSQQQEVVERIVQADTSGPAFLWCCRYLVDHWQAVEDPATVFTSPAEANSVLLKQMCLHDTHGDSFAAVFVLAMLGKGRFLHRKTGVQSELKSLGFKKYCDDHLAEYEDILLGSVLSETDQGFSSRAWYDAAGLALGRSFRLPTLLEVCDVTFLVQHVTVTDKIRKALKILVGSGPFASLARKNESVIEDCHSLTQRLCEEIIEGNLPEICRHTALRCSEFLLEMTEYCRKEKYSTMQLVRAVDKVHDLPLLYWPAINDRHAITDWYLALRLLADREVDETDRDGNTLLHIAADKRNLEVITLAVKSGASLTKTNNKGLTPYQLAQLRRQEFSNATDIGYVVYTLFTEIRGGNDVAVKTLLCYGSSVHDMDYYGRTGLLVACEVGQGNIADLLIDLGADVNGRVPSVLGYSETPLYHACPKGLSYTADLLVKHDADLNARDEWKQTALHCACQCESPTASADITRLLLDAGADVNARDSWGRTPLHNAALRSNTETLRRLIHHEADLNATDYKGRLPLHCAYTASKPGIIITQLVEAGAETGRVHQAVVRGDVDALMTLLQQGADVNQHDTSMGCSPLHTACLMGRTDIVTCLTQRGAKVNAVDDTNRTPLHIACAAGQTQVARQLIDEGADVKAKDESQSTPLRGAADTENVEIVVCLLEHGAQVDATDVYDYTPLQKACWNGHTQTAECLLQHGANVNAVLKGYGTPLHTACEKGRTQTAQCLLQHGADVNAVSRRVGTPLDVARNKLQHCDDLVTLLVQHGAVSRHQVRRTT